MAVGLVLVLGGMPAVVSTVARSAAQAPEPTNVVVIFADDLGYGDLGCYGSATIPMPQLDRLAADGLRLTNFYVGQAVCTASRAALLTGCNPNRIGMAGALNHLSTTGIHPAERLLGELLEPRGYATAAFGKWHLGLQPPFWPTSRGFDEFFGIPYSNDNGPLHPVFRDLPPLPLYDGGEVVERDPDQAPFTRRFTDRAVRFIERHEDRPFFLYVPHVPIFATSSRRPSASPGRRCRRGRSTESTCGRCRTAWRGRRDGRNFSSLPAMNCTPCGRAGGSCTCRTNISPWPAKPAATAARV